MGRIQTSKLIPATPAEVFQYVSDFSHASEWLEPEISLEFPTPLPSIGPRSELELVVVRFGIRTRVTLRVECFSAPESFSYRQISGFFRSWSHSQILTPHDKNVTLLADIVEFKMPFGIVGAILDDVLVRRDLEHLLNLRLERIKQHFSQTARD